MGLPPRVGEVLAGKYRVERVVGSGGMGVVLEATHLRLGTRVAVKVLSASSVHDPKHHARFLREARAAARLKSEHVARVLDVDDLAPGVPFLVMELLDGEDLDKVLAERGTIPVEEAVGYLLQACEGVAEAHAAGIVHRDLKPSNLFLTREADVKLLDFGVSKLAEGSAELALTGKDTRLGSPAYMAPEQRRAAAQVDHRADIFSLGVILYEMLAGRLPFVAEPGVSLTARMATAEPPPLDDVPEDLEQAVRRCLAKKADERFADVGALARALAPFAPNGAAAAARIERVLAAPRPVAAPPSEEEPAPLSGPTTMALDAAKAKVEAPRAPVRPLPSKRRLPAVTIVALAAAGVVIAIYVWSKQRVPADPAPPSSAAAPSPPSAQPPKPSVSVAPTMASSSPPPRVPPPRPNLDIDLK